MIALNTSRVGTPTDNGNAEQTAKFVTQHIIVPMKSDITCFSRDEVNRYLVSEVDRLNNMELQKSAISRNELFFADEHQELLELPAKPYAPIIYRNELQTPSTYLVRYKGNEYSVPFELAHKRIEIKVRGTSLTILHQNRIRAIHDVIEGTNNVIRLNEHLTPEHKAQIAKNKDNYLEWARSIGCSTTEIIAQQYSGHKNPASRIAGKYCQRLQSLCSKYGEDVFEDACSYAYTHNMVSPNDLEVILKARPFDSEAGMAEFHPAIAHDNIRGSEYFGGHKHD